MNISKVSRLFEERFLSKPDFLLPLPPSGSHRRYFRVGNGNISCIGAFNKDKKENDAFIGFARSFFKLGLPVPEVYSYDEGKEYYLIEDLGDRALIDELENSPTTPEKNESLIKYFQQALAHLARFQIYGKDAIDFSLCIPRDSFDKQSMLWDLNHFKYFFVKLSGIPFDEQKLEDDFNFLSGALDKVERDYFMYRDFQSRNIMIHNGSCYFIDFQGGRKGALQYDVASILFEAKTHLTFALREELLDFYLSQLEQFIPVDKNKFREDYFGFVLIRVLQALGAYGLRGWVEKKVLFLQSIPHAVRNLEWLLSENKIHWHLPELKRICQKFTEDKRFGPTLKSSSGKLKVEINSFSYRKPLPDDLTGNGGGFIFDCRAVNNPGLVPELRNFTGKDPEIDQFFREKSAMHEFLEETFQILSRSIEVYTSKKFEHLQVNFGCTGGRHRSVYAAEQIARKIQRKFDVEVSVWHRELEDIERQDP